MKFRFNDADSAIGVASGQAFVNWLKDKIEAGRFVPVIDRRYPLDEIADAYRYVQTGEKTGVVVLDIVTECREVKAMS